MHKSFQSQLQPSQSTKKPYTTLYSPLERYTLPDFLNIQRLSFQAFLKTGLITEFEKTQSLFNSTKTFEIFFHAKHYKLLPCKWTPKQAILKRKSYTCPLYIPVQLSNLLTGEIQLQWVLLAHLPLMTKHGHFIINGCPRILMNQMVRSPGVYFKKIEKKKPNSPLRCRFYRLTRFMVKTRNRYFQRKYLGQI